MEQTVVQACFQNSNMHTNSPNQVADFLFIKTENLEMSIFKALQYMEEKPEDFKCQQSN